MVNGVLQHGLIQGQLNIQDFIEADLTAFFEPVGAFEGKWMCTADVVQGAGQIKGAGVFASFGFHVEQACMGQAALGQDSIARLCEQANILLDFCGHIVIQGNTDDNMIGV